MSNDVQNNFTVQYSTANNTAVSTSDYGEITSTTLTFGGTHSNTQTFTVTIQNDDIAEETGYYYINLGNLITNSQPGVSIYDNQGLGTITDNDVVHLTLNSFTVTETDGSQTEYFGTDPSLIRLLWILLTLVYGTGFVLYVILWIVLPEK